MLNIYTSYECRICRKEFVLLTEDTERLPVNRYITCPYCNSRHIRKQRATDNLRECMQERSYRRVHGSIRQVKHE